MSEPAPQLYTREEWAAMTDHDRALLREHRRRAVERERERHQARQALLDELTAERYGHG